MIRGLLNDWRLFGGYSPDLEGFGKPLTSRLSFDSAAHNTEESEAFPCRVRVQDTPRTRHGADVILRPH